MKWWHIVLLCLNTAVYAQTKLVVGAFSAGEISAWNSKSFAGMTYYTLVTDGDQRVLKASSNAAASAFYREIAVDLEKTPYLNWRWRIDGVLRSVDERTKAGDDYPARVYVVVSGGMMVWRTRALNYAWSSNQAIDSHWDNAYTNNVKMLALRSGAASAGAWRTEKRNVRDDFNRLFGEDITAIDGVAIMTDTDNSGQTATAWYGDIYFSSE